MKKEKIFLIAFLLILTISFTQATIQELVNSYNFDYYGEEIDIGNITDYIKDNHLYFNISVKNATTQNYKFYIDIKDTKGILTAKKTITISSQTKVLINISTYLLSGKNQFNYTLRIYDSNENLVYRQGNLTTKIYSYETSYEILNIIDSNVNNDFIQLNLTINSTLSSNENVSIFLEYENKSISFTKEFFLNQGINYLIFNIDNETIKSTHYNGEYKITTLSIGKKIILLNYTTNNYSYEKFAKTSYLKNYSSSFIDLDSNNLTDYLQFDFVVNVKQSGNHSIKAEIYDLYGQFLTSINKNKFLEKGEQKIPIKINTSQIYSSKIDGPYLIGISRLFLEDNLIDFQLESHATKEISHYNFERPPLPDLEISMTNNFDGNNKVNVTIQNKGDAKAFAVTLDFFDFGNYNLQLLKDSLDINETYSFEILINESIEQGILISVVDFNNLIDEKNETNNDAFVKLTNSLFSVENSLGEIVADFDNFGNLNLKGTCSVSQECIAPKNSFIVQNSNYETVAYISSEGNLCLEKDNCSNYYQQNCNPSNDAFIIQNKNLNISYIDFQGKLCLTGNLKENF